MLVNEQVVMNLEDLKKLNPNLTEYMLMPRNIWLPMQKSPKVRNWWMDENWAKIRGLFKNLLKNQWDTDPLHCSILEVYSLEMVKESLYRCVFMPYVQSFPSHFSEAGRQNIGGFFFVNITRGKIKKKINQYTNSRHLPTSQTTEPWSPSSTGCKEFPSIVWLPAFHEEQTTKDHQKTAGKSWTWKRPEHANKQTGTWGE